jgi:TP901 family phage tail tape measure protein
MAAEERRNVTIYINGKEVTNNISSITREFHRQRAELNKTTRGTKEYQQRLNELKRTKSILDNHRNAIRGIGSETNKAGKLQQIFNNIAGKTKGLLGAALGPLAAIGAAVAVFNRAKTTIQEFNVSLDELQSITGAADEDMKFFQATAVETSKRVGISAKEIVEAYKLVGSAKPELLQNKEALASVTEEAIILSQATGMELAGSVDSLTTIMNANNATADETNRYINALAAGSQAGAKEVDFLSQAMKNVGPVAKSANIEIEEQVALLELLGEKGVDASKAGTGLRNVILTLQADTSNYTNGVFDLNKAFDSLESQQADTIALQDQFGKENVVTAQILAQNRGRFEELTEAVTDTNTAYEQAAINTDNSAAAQARFTAKLDALFLKFSEGDGLFTKLIDAAGLYLDIVGERIDDMIELGSELGGAFAELLVSMGLITSEGKTMDFIFKILSTTSKATFLPLKALVTGLSNGFQFAALVIDNLKFNLMNFPKIFSYVMNGVLQKANSLIETANKLPGVDIDFRFSTEEMEFPELGEQAQKTKDKLAEIAENGKDFFVGIKDDFAGIWGDEPPLNKMINETDTEKAADDAAKILDDVVKKVEEKASKRGGLEFMTKVDAEEIQSELLGFETLEDAKTAIFEKGVQERAEIANESRDQQEQADIDAEKRKEEAMAFGEMLLDESVNQFLMATDRKEEKELARLQSQFEAGVLNEQQLEDRKLEVQKQAFQKKKAVDIAQALINGALAITKVTAQTGVLSPFAIPTIVATTLAQVATIGAQKFEEGGEFLLNGPSHSQGGMPVLNPRTGQKVAELEGNEYIIRKNAVNSDTLPILNRINQSQGNIRYLNLDAYQSSARKYAQGGQFEPTGSVPLGNGDQGSMNGSADVVSAINQLSQTVNGWQRDFSVNVSQQQLNDGAEKERKVKKFADVRA